MGFPRPCLDCGILTLNSNRCDTHKKIHQQKIDAKRINKRNHYKGNYQRRAKLIRETAQVCHICKQGYKPNDPFQADHVIPGDTHPDSLLLPAHRSCNIRKKNQTQPPTRIK